MSGVLNMPTSDLFRQKSNPIKSEKQLSDDFARMCREVWTSAERMAWDLSDYSLDVTVSACKSYRKGKTEPRLALGLKIIETVEKKIEDDAARLRSRVAAVK